VSNIEGEAIGGRGQDACSRHDSVEATQPCPRCGDFLCATCRTENGGASFCPACYQRAVALRAKYDLGERCVRSTSGLFHLLGLVLLGSIGLAVFWTFAVPGSTWSVGWALYFAFVGACGIAAFVVGRRINGLTPEARVAGLVVGVAALLTMPLALPFAVHVLSELIRHGHVTSAAYREAVTIAPPPPRGPPQVTPVWQWIAVFAFIVGSLALGVLASLVSPV